MSRRIITYLLGLLIICTAHNLCAEEENTYNSITAGFSITKPEEWVFLSLDAIERSRTTARLGDEELEKAVRERANAPLVVIARYPEPYDDLNPSAQVMLRPLGQLSSLSPAKILSMNVDAFGQVFSDFEIVEDIQAIQISGLDAAYVKMKYTAVNPVGVDFPTLSRMWIIPRGQFMFMMSMSGPQEGPNVSEEYFSQILESIKIEK